MPQTLEHWERHQRPITDHVQRFSYAYGYVLGKWPAAFELLRSDAVSALAKTSWFEEALNRGARHVPMGFEGARAPHLAPLAVAAHQHPTP